MNMMDDSLYRYYARVGRLELEKLVGWRLCRVCVAWRRIMDLAYSPRPTQPPSRLVP